ncbi:MAG TPA: ABC transporter permease [Devosia sp.]|nr:ABC transporter permease [Devosia sp.]
MAGLAGTTSAILPGRFLLRREPALALLLLLLLVVIGVRAPGYVTPGNLVTVLVDSSVLCILVVGQLFALLIRGIDLSTAANLAFVGMFLALLSEADPGLPAIAYLLLAALAGLLLGALNAVFIAVIGVPPIICTLGTMVIYRGMIFILSGGAWVSSHEMSQPFQTFPLETWIGLPNIVLVAIVVAASAWLFLRFSSTGRAFYAVGSSPLGATFAGISIRRTTLLAFTLSGLCSGIAGYLWTARYAIAFTQAGEGLEFAVIAACFIGGVSVAGGRGSVAGVLIGALFISVVQSALPFVRVSPFVQTAISGTIILIAVAVNSRAERPRGRQILEAEDVQRNPGRGTLEEPSP